MSEPNDPNDPNGPVFPTDTDEPEDPEDSLDPAPPGEEGDGGAHDEGEGASATPTEGGTLHQHPTANVQANETEFPALVARHFAERGTKVTGDAYANHMKRFLVWCATNNYSLRTLPPDTAMRYLEETFPNPVTRATANAALRAGFDIGARHNVQIAAQEIIREVRPVRSRAKPKPPPSDSPAAPAPTAPAAPAMGSGGLFTPAPGGETSSPAQPAASQRVSQPRSTPGVPRSRTGIPSLGNRIRISKRADGTEGYPPGTMILVGVYGGADLEGEGAIEEFLANRVRPIYGPKPGATIPSTYYVDRLDNLGNTIPGSTVQVPVMPPLTEPGSVPPQQYQPPFQQQQTPAPAQGASFDNFVSYLMRRQEEAERKYESLLEQMRSQASQKGVDPTMFMLMAERMRPEPIDLGKAAEEWKRANPGADVKFGRRKLDHEDDPFDVPMHRGGLPGTPSGPYIQPPGGGFGGGMDFGGGGHDANTSMFVEVLKQQGEMMREILTRSTQQPAPNAPMSPRDLFEMFSQFSTLMRPAEPKPNPIMEQLAQIALQQATKPPEPAKGVTDLIASLRELRDAQEILGGVNDDKPLSFGEVITAGIEHAQQIGEAVASVVSSIPRAPVIPVPVGVPVGTGPRNGAHAGAPQRAVTPPLAAQQAFGALQTATEDQQIVTLLIAILTEYMGAPDPWPNCSNQIMTRFKRATTGAEVYSLVTDLYVWSGAKSIMNAAVLARVTSALVRNYSAIYAKLTGGGRKVFSEVDPTVTSAPDPEAAERGVAVARAAAGVIEAPGPAPESRSGDVDESRVTYTEETPGPKSIF